MVAKGQRSQSATIVTSLGETSILRYYVNYQLKCCPFSYIPLLHYRMVSHIEILQNSNEWVLFACVLWFNSGLSSNTL